MGELFYILAIFFFITIIVGQEYSNRVKYKKLEDSWREQDEYITELIEEKYSCKTIQCTEIDDPLIFEFLKEFKTTLKTVKFEKIKRPASHVEQDECYFKFSVKFLDKELP